MKSRPLDELIPQVKKNCDISDSRHWGYHSICGLLLRLRELYRFEKGVKPWEKVPEGEITKWIGEREALWESLSEEELRPLEIGGEEFAPFEVGRINARLAREGLLYGAGYGIYCKPVFFLAELLSKETEEGYEIFVAGTEFVRDLSIHPAMLQGRDIFARKDVLVLLLWEKFEEMGAKKTPGALAEAFGAYGISAGSEGPEIEGLIEDAAGSELRTYIHHELGEALESEKNPVWDEMLSCVVRSRASIFARAVKDTLADASERGMLRHVIEERKAGSLAFYAASLSGYRKLLAPEMAEACRGFFETGDWSLVESARGELYERASRIADFLTNVYMENKDPEALAEGIQRQINILQPS
ncbi:MAG: hypothetical protein P8Y85_03415 [Nitrospirota bacterium]|jgi:hypothetical protein